MKIQNLQLDSSMLLAVLKIHAAWGEIPNHSIISAVEANLDEGDLSKFNRTLLDIETAVVAYLLLLRSFKKRPPYTLGELARALDKRREGAARQRIKTMLSRVGVGENSYGLFVYSEPGNGEVGRDGFKISASERLHQLWEESLKPNLEPYVTVDFSIEEV